MWTPSPTVFASARRSRLVALVSAKSRLPAPTITGSTCRWSASTRSCSIASARAARLPCRRRRRVALLELRHLFDHVTAEHGRVVPPRVLEGRGDDVFRHRVELVGELPLEAWPDGGEAVVGDAAEQQCIRRHRLVQLELLTLRPSRERVCPADPLEVLRTARRLHHAVDGDVLGYDDPSHFFLLLVCSGGRSGCPTIIINSMVDKPIG